MAESRQVKENKGIMTYMRDHTHIVIYALVISFVGFIIFSWGMDILGKNTATNQGVLAKVNGTEITYQNFRFRMSNQIELLRQQLGTSPDIQFIQLLEDQLFNDMVNEILIREAIDDLGLVATDADILQEVRFRPRPEFVNNPDLQTEDGQFDVAKYHTILSQLTPNDYLILEFDARAQIPQIKLQDLIVSTFRVTDEEMKQSFIQNESFATVEYIVADNNRFADITFDISDRDIEDYYTSHLDDFYVNETRRLKYVIFEVNPTVADSAAIDITIEEALIRAKAGEDFSDLALEYTNSDGDLGMFAKGTMMAEFENAIFDRGVNEGDIIGPVDTPLGRHIILIEELRKRNGEIDSVRAHHMLFNYVASPGTEDNVDSKAQDFAFRAGDEGFDLVADELGLTPLETVPFSRTGFIPGFGTIPEVESFAFRSEFDVYYPPVSDVIETPLGFVVFQLSEVVEAKTRSLDDGNLRFSIRQILTNEQQILLAQNFMARIKNNIESGISFSESASNEGLEVNSPDPFKINDYISGIGSNINFTSVAFSLEQGEISNPVTSGNSVYLIKLTEKDAFNEELFAEKKGEIAANLLQQKRNFAFSSWLFKLRESSEINDYRDRFFVR